MAIAYLRNTSGVSKLSLGGGDSSVNASTAVGIYCGSALNTTTGTEVVRAKGTSGGTVRIGGSGNPDGGAGLDIQTGPQSMGFLPPRCTTSQRNAISSGSPTTGMIVYNSTTSKLQVYSGGSWVDLH